MTLALFQFMEKLSSENVTRAAQLGWTMGSDPCIDKWTGVTCEMNSVSKIFLENVGLNGVFDAVPLCSVKSLNLLSLINNTISGTVSEEIGRCQELTHLNLSGNKLSGRLPDSLSRLGNLKRLEIFDNNFSGELPDLARISGLLSFLAENNNLSGAIPNFDFPNFESFNVSNNHFSGPIPDVQGHFTAESFNGNPELCGKPLSTSCPPASPLAPPPSATKPKASPLNGLSIYSGYIILVVGAVLFFAAKFSCRKKAKEEEKADVAEKKVARAAGNYKSSEITRDLSFGINRSEHSMSSFETSIATSTLVVLTRPLVKDLRFEDLLQAPAELLGRGKNGSVFKVTLDKGVVLAVKRIKDWEISQEDLRRRMGKINQLRHSNVLLAIAFYSSKDEKLLVYEFQQNGSLFELLHGPQDNLIFDWGSRLRVAATVAETLAYMHKVLYQYEIPHGNLKSTNILFDKDMNPCISEYGLLMAENQDESFLSQTKGFKRKGQSGRQPNVTFKPDVYAFGVILLELLTGKLVQNNGSDLASWVQTVVREEWTVEVFDTALISEGVNEERMVNLLQIALKCINPSPSERPSMNQVAPMVTRLKEEELRSISFDTGSVMYMGESAELSNSVMKSPFLQHQN